MTPEREAELFVKLDMLIDLARRQAAQIDALTGRVGGVEQGLARIDGRIEDMPTARDFGRLEGRVEALAATNNLALARQIPRDPPTPKPGRHKPAAE